MKKHNKKVTALLKSAVKAMIGHDSDEWPPECAIFIYQPVHPRAKNTELQEKQDKNEV